MISCAIFFFFFFCFRYSQVRVGNETIKSNLQAYRYHFEDNAMDNGFVDKRNKCFCRDGKLNVERMKETVQKAHTSPHFEWIPQSNSQPASPPATSQCSSLLVCN